MQSVGFGNGKCFANNTICVVLKQRHEKRSLLWDGKTQTMINKFMQMMQTAKSLNDRMPHTFAAEKQTTFYC